LIVFCSSLYSQKNNQLLLKIIGKDSIENSYIKNTRYLNKHATKISLNKEVDSVLEELKRSGFFTLQIDSSKTVSKSHSYYVSLHKRIERVHIKINPTELPLFKDYKVKQQNTIELRTEELTQFMKDLQSIIENNGEAFGKINLENQQIEKGVLFANLKIQHSKRRTLDSLIIKGYTKIPKSLYKNLIPTKSKFTKNSVHEVSNIIKNSKYIAETKTPEILFSKDSTILYVYLKKVDSNSFDGLINFSSNEETNKIELKGYLDLNLNNTFNIGEELELKWKNNGGNRQNLNIKIKVPYVFGTKLHIETNFNLYRHDSTFTNTNLSLQTTYFISKKSRLGLMFASNNSNDLQNQSTIEVQDFTKKEIGLSYHYKNNIEFNLYTAYGARISNNQNTKQSQIKFDISNTYKITDRLQLYVKNTTAILNSNNYLQNELYRIGGVNSVRGFNEQSIFTSKYSYINSEFRVSTKGASYLYSIVDFGIYNNLKQNILGAGVGYLISNKNSVTTISYSIGKFSRTPLNLRSSKLSIKTVIVF
jgi:hemolysin activation/secretion protein